MYYSEEIVEEVRQRSDIVDVISRYVKLTKRGSTYFGLCPFHNEKTGSFSVTPSKQMYYCFGCGAGGNVFTFLMEYDNLSFPEALKQLADSAGVKLPDKEESEEEKKNADLRMKLLEINKLAARYFYYQLKGPTGVKAMEYLKGRALTDETITHFGLGYSNQTSNDLYRFLRSKGYKDELLAQTGLVRIEERGAYDKFWNRVMFPIMDVNNRVIGFGGRVMGDGTPKYLNSPETKLFDKSRNLFGLNWARLSRKPQILICEGYMDVISMHQAGFTNSVASLGTAFTLQHANLIKRYTDQVILTYDSDGAGVKAALRAIPILKNAGLSMKVLNMRPYKDPDEFIKNLGSEEFQKRIDEAQNSFMYEIDRIRDKYQLSDPEQKTAFHREVARKLLEFPEKDERDNYMEAVCREHMIPLESMNSLLGVESVKSGAARTQQAEAYPQTPADEPVRVRSTVKKRPDEGIRKAQRLLLTWLIEDPSIYQRISKLIDADDFTDDLYHRAAVQVFEQLKNDSVNPAQILNSFINDEGEYKEVAALFNATLSHVDSDQDKEKALTDVITRVKLNSIDEQVKRTTDFAVLQKLVRQKDEIKRFKLS